MNHLINNKYPFFVLLLIFLTLLLTACADKQQPKQKTNVKKETQKETTPYEEADWKLPISIPEGEFFMLGGWLSDTEVLYITNLEQTSSVYRYNLLSGKSKLIYKSEYPIVTVKISPSKKNILIHSSPSSYEGVVTIIDKNGSEQMKQSFASYELDFEWNLFNESQILVTKFDEDWKFQLSLLDTSKLKTVELSLPQPFIKWIDEKNVAYLNWDENTPSLFAPLIIRSIETGKEKTVLPEVIQFSTFPDLLMTVSVKKDDSTVAVYTFFDKELKESFTFSIPQLTKFSDWLVPFYDYSKNRGQFITFEPLSSGEVDSYTEGFKLVSYNIKRKKSELIMEHLDNEPILFSPSGNALLYGNRFEKIIDLKTKEIYELIKE
ncbi:hypothetical protein [Neobacillus sp. PS2-9]|uniref:YqgU-like beta propeller domain-containing protein n=1 Tax=Neobacillus sp. PS2-9 TaxID=3070676 RepID=UPI0027E0304B|nr:hypothetical protein [Neobacillus sp. PS2-9]WML59746.1 hypothetical protein RCG25_08230 [Neobacillus sp. PS2-9]